MQAFINCFGGEKISFLDGITHTASLTSLSGRAARAGGKSLDSVGFIALIAPELSVYHRHYDEVSYRLPSFKVEHSVLTRWRRDKSDISRKRGD